MRAYSKLTGENYLKCLHSRVYKQGLEQGLEQGEKRRKLRDTRLSLIKRNHDYETSVSFMKIAEVNGKAREEFVPFHYVTQTQLERDDILDYAMNEIRTKIDSN